MHFFGEHFDSINKSEFFIVQTADVWKLDWIKKRRDVYRIWDPDEEETRRTSQPRRGGSGGGFRSRGGAAEMLFVNI